MKGRVLYVIKAYLLTVAIFALAKVGFLLTNGSGQTLADYWAVWYHGLSLDLSTALYFIILPYVLSIISFWIKPHKWIWQGYYLLIAFFFSLAFVADTSLYPFWHFKLDSSCLQYLSTPTEAMASVTVGYLLARLFFTAILTLLLYLAYALIKRPFVAVHRRLVCTLCSLIGLPVIVIGIRGGLDESTTNVGQVYFSQEQFLNHSAINPVFSFISSFEKTASYIPAYHFMEEAERAKLMKGLYPTESVQSDTLLNTTRPNVVIILLESMGGIFTADIGRREDIMPHFNQLVKEGVYFANFYANSYRTDRGTLCTYSGYPSFPRSSVMKMPSKTRFLAGIGRSLRDNGYTTHYLYGGDINFTNMRSYLITTGFEHLLWKKDFSQQEQQTAEWGVRDDITFKKLYDVINQQDKPFLIGYSTLSSHEPWDVPTHRLQDEVANAFNYLDECLYHFVEQIKKTPQWKDLLIVMLPDHGYSYFGVDEDNELHDHVPMLWLGGAIKNPRRIEQLCNQTDLCATLLGQMAITHDDYPFSRDVMSRNYTYPFAVHTYNNGITMKDSTGFAVYDLNANSIIVNKSTNGEALIRRGMAILQTASEHINSLGKK